MGGGNSVHSSSQMICSAIHRAPLSLLHALRCCAPLRFLPIGHFELSASWQLCKSEASFSCKLLAAQRSISTMMKSSGMLDESVHAHVSTRFEAAMADLAEKADRQNAEAARGGEGGAAAAVAPAAGAGRGGGADETKAQPGAGAGEASDVDSDDELLADPELERLREKRMRELKKQHDKERKGFGDYREIVEEEFLPEVTSTKRVVVHFFHRDFERCKITDMASTVAPAVACALPEAHPALRPVQHLERVARTLVEVKFLKLNAEKAPFFVEKLAVRAHPQGACGRTNEWRAHEPSAQIRALPTIVMFVDGVAQDRIVGFADLGNRDVFKTRVVRAPHATQPPALPSALMP